MIILGIETSCDDTSISLYDSKKKNIINKTIHQHNTHNKYGGIMPELASQKHFINILNIIKKIKKKIKYVDLIAYTAGPGLPNSLLIGVTTSKILSYLYNIPSIPINHIEGHIMSIMLFKKKPKFPFLTLITSGVNTLLVIVYNFNKYKIIGKSLDDSAGKVFDKISNLIGLEYPGGPKLAKLAKLGQKYFVFPKPIMNNKTNLNFSFSGLQTHVINLLKKIKIINQKIKANIAYALEDTITDILLKKTIRATKIFNLKRIAVVGGVSANKKLRKKFFKNFKYKKNIFFPLKKYCTDNATMIAYTGLIKFNNKKYFNKYNNFKIKINPKWVIGKKL